MATDTWLPSALAQYLDDTHGPFRQQFDEVLKATTSGYHFYEGFGWMNDHVYLSWNANGEPTIVYYIPRCSCGAYHDQPSRQQDYEGEAVKIFVGDEYVQDIPQDVLTRFSRSAKKVFKCPRQHPVSTPEREDSAVEELCKVSARRKRIDIKPKKVFVLRSKNASVRSKKCHVARVLDWMLENDARSEHDKITELASREYLAASSFRSLINLYAVARAFALQHFPNNLLQHICAIISDDPLDKTHFAYLYENLFVDDQVMTYAITAFYKHLQLHDAEHIGQKVLDYVNTLNDGGVLSRRFAAMRRDMERQDKTSSPDRQMDPNKMKHGHDLGKEEPVSKPSASRHVEAAEQVSTSQPRRRKRREQQSKGKARAAAGAAAGAAAV